MNLSVAASVLAYMRCQWRRVRLALALGIACALYTTAVLPETSFSEQTSGSTVEAVRITEAAFSWNGYFMALGFMFLLLGLLWFALRFLKKSGGLRFFAGDSGMQVESRCALGAKKHLLMVNYLGKRLLLGVTEHHISLLGEYPPDDIETGKDISPKPGPVPVPDEFKKLLASAGKHAGK